MNELIVTSSGRPLGKFPLRKFRDDQGGFFLKLLRVDVSDAGKPAEAFYLPLVKFVSGDGMTSIEIRLKTRVLIVFLSRRRISFYVTPSQG